jgi:RNA polymerase sigma-70 factor, ECF subfamily
MRDRAMLTDKQSILNELLILRCKRGDRQAFEELVRLWEDRMFYYIRRLVGTEEDACDVLQQTWLMTFKAIQSLDGPQSFATWLYRIARRAAMTHWRGQYRANSHREEIADLEAIASADEEMRLDDAEQVHFGLSCISLEHREALTLFFLDDLSLDQMAEVLGVPVGTVKSRLHYAKRSLCAVLRHQEGNHER